MEQILDNIVQLRCVILDLCLLTSPLRDKSDSSRSRSGSRFLRSKGYKSSGVGPLTEHILENFAQLR